MSFITGGQQVVGVGNNNYILKQYKMLETHSKSQDQILFNKKVGGNVNTDLLNLLDPLF